MQATKGSIPNDSSLRGKVGIGSRFGELERKVGQNRAQERGEEPNKSNNPSQQSHNVANLKSKQTGNNGGPTANKVDSPSATGGVKIDGDLVNVANENRVILNVGGIRHETYKVSSVISVI